MKTENGFARTSLAVAFLLAGAQGATPAAAAVAPSLGAAHPFTVLGTNGIATSGTVSCTTSTINGDVGSTFDSITDIGCTINGSISAPVDAAVVADFDSAYSQLDSLNPACDDVIPITSTTLAPGVYCSAAGTTFGAGVILTLDGDASDVWVFRVGTGGSGALTGNSFQVVMGGSALPCNVYWRTAEAATLTSSSFIGSILAGTAVTVTGGNFLGRAMASTDVTLTNVVPMTFAGCAGAATITVSKDFLPDSAASVDVDLTCTSGTVVATPLSASEAEPAVFTLAGADPGTTCTATETVPTGYTADQSNCVDVPVGGSCVITNALNANAIVVHKDFVPDVDASVSVSLLCTSGAPLATPLDASESAPAVFEINGADPGVTCTATEIVPFGYTADQSDCIDVPLGGSCTIFNSRDSVVAIPTLSSWGMILLVGFLSLLGIVTIRRLAK